MEFTYIMLEFYGMLPKLHYITSTELFHVSGILW